MKSILQNAEKKINNGVGNHILSIFFRRNFHNFSIANVYRWIVDKKLFLQIMNNFFWKKWN